METSEKPAPSSEDRIACTLPSIMSLGATMYAPARACATSHLHRAILIPCGRARRVFRLGHAEENDAADFRLRRCFRVTKHLVNRRLIHAGHRSNRPTKFFPIAHEDG